MLLTIGGIDPSLTNTGLAKGVFDTETGKFIVSSVRLIETEKLTGKTVRQNSDDLRRGGDVSVGIHSWIADCAAVFAEIPTGAQSARAAWALGMVTGILSTIGTVGGFRGKLIQVMPSEVKKEATGSKNADKQEMIDWASGLWPDVEWFRVKKTGALIKKNEHMADACGAINAGVNTDQFKSLVQMLNSLNVKSS